MSVPCFKPRWLTPILRIGCALCVLHAAGMRLAPVCGADADIVGDPGTPQTPASPEPADAPGVPDAAGEQVDPNDRDAKRRAVSIGLLGLMGIVLAGLGLLVLVILWGHRVRRITRSSAPQTTLGDELWYLRPDKQRPPAPSNPPDEQDGRDSSTNSP